MTVFGDLAFKEAIELKQGHQGGPRFNVTCILIRKNETITKRDTKDMPTKKNWSGHTMPFSQMAYREGGHFQGKKRCLGRNQSRRFDPGLLPLEL